MTETDRLLVDDRTAAQMLDMGRSTFRAHVRCGRLPQPMRIGGLTRWRVADLLAFVNSREAASPDGGMSEHGEV